MLFCPVWVETLQRLDLPSKENEERSNSLTRNNWRSQTCVSWFTCWLWCLLNDAVSTVWNQMVRCSREKWPWSRWTR